MGEPATTPRCECSAASICEREPVCRNRIVSLTCGFYAAIAVSLAFSLSRMVYCAVSGTTF